MPKEKYVKTKKIKNINFYNDNATKEYMLELQNTYHCSFSTICDKACRLPLMQKHKQFLEQKRYSELTGYRTVLKVKYFEENPSDSRVKETNFASNVVMLVCRFKLKPNPNYTLTNDQKEIDKNYNQFINELKKSRDIYWDFNARYRQQIRAMKQYNKEYGNKQ